MAAAVLLNTSENVDIVQATRTPKLNWWGFGFEIDLIIRDDIKVLLETIEIPKENRLNVAEWKPPT